MCPAETGVLRLSSPLPPLPPELHLALLGVSPRPPGVAPGVSPGVSNTITVTRLIREGGGGRREGEPLPGVPCRRG